MIGFFVDRAVDRAAPRADEALTLVAKLNSRFRASQHMGCRHSNITRLCLQHQLRTHHRWKLALVPAALRVYEPLAVAMSAYAIYSLLYGMAQPHPKFRYPRGPSRQQRDEEILRLYVSGTSYKELQERFRLSERQIRKACWRADPEWWAKQQQERREPVRRAVIEEGLSLAQAAARFGISTFHAGYLVKGRKRLTVDGIRRSFFTLPPIAEQRKAYLESC